MKISKELLKGSTAIMILKVISEGETYGYELVQRLYHKSQGTFKLNEGTLYPILHMLEKEGHVTSYEGQSETGRSRRYYRITVQGKLHLSARMEEWQVFSDAVTMVLGKEGV